MRFWRGRAQVIGGWELLVGDTLDGVCRKVFPWTDTSAILNIAFGTNTKLTLFQGGATYDITPVAFVPGAVDGTGGQGYGTGAYSTGEYSEPSTADYFPLTWSMAAWGQELIACPRGQPIFTWQNVTGSPATAVANGPANVTYTLVAPMDGGYQLFAIGCNEEVSGTFNPLCIRHSSVRDYTEWTTGTATTAREYILTGGGRLVAAAMCGSNMLVWTSLGLCIGTFVGSLDQPWRFDPVAIECGLIGPNAFAIVGQRAFWIGPDLNVYGYALGGQPVILDCPIREQFADNMAASQGDKITASAISAFNEIRFDYPDSRDGVENSRYIAAHVPTLLSNPELAWYRGIMERTAVCDAPPVSSATPIATTSAGVIYWHERGQSADGSAFSWFIETADNYLDPSQTMMLRRIYPDFKDQVGPVMTQVTTRYSPQGDETLTSFTTVAPGARQSDGRATGLLHRIKFYGSSAPTAGRLGSPILDVAPAGGR